MMLTQIKEWRQTARMTSLPSYSIDMTMIVAMMRIQTKMAKAIAKAMAMMIVKTMKREIMSTKRNSMRTVLAKTYQMCLVPCREHVVAGPSGSQIISFPP